jgi:DNA polymerase I
MELLIDGPYLAHRSMTTPHRLSTSNGIDSTMIFYFLNTIKALQKRFNPSETIIAWESHGTPSWRRKLLPTYKPGNGNPTAWILDIQQILHDSGFKQYFSPENEADDVIATLAKGPSTIFTIDKDIMQLVNDSIPIRVYIKETLFNESEVKAKYGVPPHLIPDYLALVGDASDNIKGIKGIGPKKAIQILQSDSNPYDRDPKFILNRKLTTLNDSCSLQKISFFSEEILSLIDKYELISLKGWLRGL